MATVTFRTRSIAWFITGALLATAVTLMFANAWRADAAPGDTDATFVPITPCRLADTRPAPDRVGPAGTLSAADTQTFAVHGTNGECTISDRRGCGVVERDGVGCVDVVVSDVLA